MSTRVTKALKSIFLEGNTNRFWQAVNKTKLVYVMAYLQKILHLPLFLDRKKITRQIHLSTAQQSVLKDLEMHGFARADDLFQIEDFAELDKYLNEKLELADKAKNNQKVKTKDFWLRLSDSDADRQLNTQHPMIKISIKQSLLEVAAHYLKTAPFLQYSLMTYSYPMSGGPKSSQLWHNDYDGHKVLKFFIYLSDVEKDEDGPFTLLPAEISSSVKNSFFPRHLSDEEIVKYADLNKLVKIKGKKWSTLICDTRRCYHMGSRVAEGHFRIMTTSLFISLPSPYPGAANRKIEVASHLSPLQQRAIEI